jgi:hypothetical protein
MGRAESFREIKDSRSVGSPRRVPRSSRRCSGLGKLPRLLQRECGPATSAAVPRRREGCGNRRGFGRHSPGGPRIGFRRDPRCGAASQLSFVESSFLHIANTGSLPICSRSVSARSFSPRLADADHRAWWPGAPVTLALRSAYPLRLLVRWFGEGKPQHRV